MYLHLFHGRTSPEQRLESWGTDGPWIGPLKAVRTTYAHTIKLVFCRAEAAAKFGLDIEQPWLQVRECMLVHNQIFYGEWEICAQDAISHTATPILPWIGSPTNSWLEQAYEDRFALIDPAVSDE